MITLRKITLENRRAIFKLEVLEDQRRFVASNLSSVASCYVLATNGGHPFPFAIYADEQPSWNLSAPFRQGLHITAGFLIRLITWPPKGYMKASASVTAAKSSKTS